MRGGERGTAPGEETAGGSPPDVEVDVAVLWKGEPLLRRRVREGDTAWVGDVEGSWVRIPCAPIGVEGFRLARVKCGEATVLPGAGGRVGRWRWGVGARFGGVGSVGVGGAFAVVALEAGFERGSLDVVALAGELAPGPEEMERAWRAVRAGGVLVVGATSDDGAALAEQVRKGTGPAWSGGSSAGPEARVGCRPW